MFKRILRSKSLRARARWLLGILLGLVVLSLALSFGFGGFNTRPGSGEQAGTIFGRPVSREAFDREYALIRQQAEERFGTFPDVLEPFLRQQTWDRLILKEEARRRMRVGNEELARYIQSQPTFQQDGRFVPELYYRFIRGLALSPQLFEERLRDDLRIKKLVESITEPVGLTEEELRAAYAKEHERMRAALILVESSAFEPQAKEALTESLLRDYYAAHQEELRVAPRRTIAYLGMSSAEALEAEGPLSDEAVQEAYEDRRDELAREDGSVPPLEEVREEVRRRLHAERAQTRLKNLALDLEEDRETGLSFEEIAVSRARPIRQTPPLDPSTEGISDGPTASMLRAAFGVALGQMTQVFDAPDGAFLLRPVEEIPSRLPSFEDARGQVEEAVVKERVTEAARTRARELHGTFLANRQAGVRFEETCAILDVEPLRPAPFTRNGAIEPLGAVPAVTQALFALKPGELSDVLEAPSGFLIAFVEERLPFDESQFAADRDRFRNELLPSKRQERFATWLESLRQQARLTDDTPTDSDQWSVISGQ